MHKPFRVLIKFIEAQYRNDSFVNNSCCTLFQRPSCQHRLEKGVSDDISKDSKSHYPAFAKNSQQSATLSFDVSFVGLVKIYCTLNALHLQVVERHIPAKDNPEPTKPEHLALVSCCHCATRRPILSQPISKE